MAVRCNHFEDNTIIHEDIFDPEEDSLFGFCILDNVAESAFGENAHIVHRHPFYEMVFIDDADGEHIVDYSAYGKLRDVVFLISPGQTHYWKNVTKANGVLIYFNEEFLFRSSIAISSVWEVQLFKEIAQTPAIYMNEEFAESMRTIVRIMLKEYREKRKDYPEVLRACLNIMLIQFHRFHELAEQKEAGLSLKLSVNQLSLRFQNLISQKISENLSVGQYAEILGVSQSHLNEYLKKQTGKSAGMLIREAQINEIKRLLVNTELNIAEIAEKMNYQDAAYFCRAFKRETGLSPSRYRAESKIHKEYFLGKS